MRSIRGFFHRLAFLGMVLGGLVAFTAPSYAETIEVLGNHRVDSETIRAYLESGDLAKAEKELKATGLFASVSVRRVSGHIVVRVTENNIVNQVAFEGNSKLKGSEIVDQLQTKSRGPFDPAVAQSDAQHILEIYKRSGRGLANVSYRTVDLPNGRLDVVFTIKEGDKTGVKQIKFVGNQAFSDSKLRGLMSTTEMNFLSFFKTSDVYEADRISADAEAIRRYYLKNGYTDVQITQAGGVFDATVGGWVVTVGVNEGPQYRISAIHVDSRLKDVSGDMLVKDIRLAVGDVYNGDALEKSVETMTRSVGRAGYAFAQVHPRGDRDTAARTVALNFIVEEGPRVYVERINIHGNTRTRDYVIRREFEVGEGDPYNRVLIDRAERRLNGLGFFKSVRITNAPGTSPDRVIINVEVEDQSTGSFGFAAGYSTADGIIGEVSLTETNFLGRGQYLKVALSGGSNSKGIELNFTEPNFADQRIAAGFDLFRKQTDATKYAYYQNWVTGGTLRAGLPITDDFTFGARYSLYASTIKIPNTTTKPYDDCTNPLIGTTPGTPGAPALTATSSCLSNGEASLAVKQLRGTKITSLVGYTLEYNTLDDRKNPTGGIYAEFKQDFAGLGGDSHFVRTTADARYYREIMDEVVGFVRVQGGHIQGFGKNKLRLTDNFNLGPDLVRGFAPSGIGPRDISDITSINSNALGGTTYFGGTAEIQFPIFGMPREVGLKGAVFADAGTLFGFHGQTNFGGGACTPNNSAPTFTQGTCIQVDDSRKIRSSVGVSILWASPLGPIRFDYAWVISKGKYDQKQAFRFSGGTSF